MPLDPSDLGSPEGPAGANVTTDKGDIDAEKLLRALRNQLGDPDGGYSTVLSGLLKTIDRKLAEADMRRARAHSMFEDILNIVRPAMTTATCATCGMPLKVGDPDATIAAQHLTIERMTKALKIADAVLAIVKSKDGVDARLIANALKHTYAALSGAQS